MDNSDNEIYILLTRSTTYFSRIIKLATRSTFTHASIGLNGIDGIFYSFGRKYVHKYFPAGFIAEEVVQHKVYSGFTYFTLYKLTVTEEQYNKISDFIQYAKEHDNVLGYNIFGVLTTLFRVPIRRKHHFYCSQFVAHALNNAGIVGIKDPDIIKPQELTMLPYIQLISNGYIGGLQRVSIAEAD